MRRPHTRGPESRPRPPDCSGPCRRRPRRRSCCARTPRSPGRCGWESADTASPPRRPRCAPHLPRALTDPAQQTAERPRSRSAPGCVQRRPAVAWIAPHPVVRQESPLQNTPRSGGLPPVAARVVSKKWWKSSTYRKEWNRGYHHSSAPRARASRAAEAGPTRESVVDSRRRVGRRHHGRARRIRRRHRQPTHRHRPQRVVVGPAVDHRRLLAEPGVAVDFRRQTRRHVRPASGLPDRRRSGSRSPPSGSASSDRSPA